MTRPQQLDLGRPRHRIERRPDARITDPERLVTAIARAVLEVEVGRRPLSQLEPILAPVVLARLSRRDDRARRAARALGEPLVGPGAAAVVRVLVQPVHADAYEAVALVRRHGRVLSMALRVERWHDGWRVVELARPEDVAGARP